MAFKGDTLLRIIIIYIKGEFIPQYYNAHINSKGQFISMLKHKKLISIKTFKTPIKK
jgi:hypothetical protein